MSRKTIATNRRKNLRRGAKNEKDLSGLERNDAEGCSGMVSFMDSGWASLDLTHVLMEWPHRSKERHLGISTTGWGENRVDNATNPASTNDEPKAQGQRLI